MSFPNIIYGDYGDEKVAQSTSIGNLPLGTLMVLPDGRKFRHAKEGATAGVAGKLYVSEAPETSDGNIAGSGLVTLAAQTVSVGSLSFKVTTGGTAALTLDQYAGGYATFQAGTAGIGYMYKVDGNTATATTAALTATITLNANDPIAATIACGTTTVGLLKNPFTNVILRAAASSSVGVYAGVWPRAITANYYGWIQRHGPAAVLTGASALTVGAPVIADTAVAGGVTEVAATASARNTSNAVGEAMNTVTAAEYANIFLKLE